MSYDAPRPDLRASDADREATAKRLRVAAAEGRLDAYELDERLSAAYAARICRELAAAHRGRDAAARRAAGQRPAGLLSARAPSVNGWAVASLVCGLLWMWWIGSASPIVFGHMALGRIDRRPGDARPGAGSRSPASRSAMSAP